MALRPDETARLRALCCEVVAAYLHHNAVPVAQVPDLIASVHGTFLALGTGEVTVANVIRHEPRPVTPARIRDSVTDAALISFEDGKPYKTLKRHLAALGLTPDRYRAKWGLPPDYPMVSPAYSERRSALARRYGLGRPTMPREAAE
jgi:predicted transcriptional regulator